MSAKVGPKTRENQWNRQCQVFLRPSLGADTLHRRQHSLYSCTIVYTVFTFLWHTLPTAVLLCKLPN